MFSERVGKVFFFNSITYKHITIIKHINYLNGVILMKLESSVDRCSFLFHPLFNDFILLMWTLLDVVRHQLEFFIFGGIFDAKRSCFIKNQCLYQIFIDTPIIKNLKNINVFDVFLFVTSVLKHFSFNYCFISFFNPKIIKNLYFIFMILFSQR